MWINSKLHEKWNKDFGVDGSMKSVRIFKPGRRKRYLTLEKEFTKNNLMMLMEKILVGDARFKTIRGSLPTFSEEL